MYLFNLIFISNRKSLSNEYLFSRRDLRTRKHSCLRGGEAETVSCTNETDNSHLQSHRNVTVNSKQINAQNQSMIVEDIGRLVTQEHMTSKCARSLKGGTDNYKRVFVFSNLP